MNRRRSLISNGETWTETIEWKNSSGTTLGQSGFSASTSASDYDAENNYIFDVSGTSNIQIRVTNPSGTIEAMAWECDIRIDTPADINGFKMTLRMNSIGTQIYVIKSSTDGYASVLYDDNIADNEEHNLENGVLIKDIKLGEWTKLRIEARGTGQNRINKVFINQQLVFSTANSSNHYVDVVRTMWQYEGYGLMRYLKFQYLS